MGTLDHEWPLMDRSDIELTQTQLLQAVAARVATRRDELQKMPPAARAGLEQLGRLAATFRRRLGLDWIDLAKRGGDPCLDPVFLVLLGEGMVFYEELTQPVVDALAKTLGIAPETVRYTAEVVERHHRPMGVIEKVKSLFSQRVEVVVPLQGFRAAPNFGGVLGTGHRPALREMLLPDSDLRIWYELTPSRGLTVGVHGVKNPEQALKECRVTLLHGAQVKAGPSPLQQGEAHFPEVMAIEPTDRIGVEVS